MKKSFLSLFILERLLVSSIFGGGLAVAAPVSESEVFTIEAFSSKLLKGHENKKEEQARPYYFKSLDIDSAWKISRGSSEVKVALLLTGTNPQLAAVQTGLASNAGEQGEGKEKDGIDNDGNGYIDDAFGFDALAGKGSAYDELGLGTHGASTLVSSQFGLAPLVQYLPVKFCNKTGGCSLDGMIRSIEYALASEASIIYIGASGYLSAEQGQHLCKTLAQTEEKNILVVVPAGNEGKNLNDESQFSEEVKMAYPLACKLPNFLVVAGTGSDDQLAYWSNYGDNWVDVAVAGIDIEGFDHEGIIRSYSGTGLAGVVATGVAALVKSHRPAYTYQQVREALIKGTDETEALKGKVRAQGRLNAAKALQGAF